MRGRYQQVVLLEGEVEVVRAVAEVEDGEEGIAVGPEVG